MALIAAGYDAYRRGDGERALELCELGVAAEVRLGTVPESHLAAMAAFLRGSVAVDAGEPADAARHYLDGAEEARRRGVDSLCASLLSSTGGALWWTGAPEANAYADEGLALARATGAPRSILIALAFCALTRSTHDPDAASSLLDEALRMQDALGFEIPSLMSGLVITSARISAWPTAARAARRAVHHQLRSGWFSPFLLAGILNLAARSLAQARPEPAMVLLGAAGAQFGRLQRSDGAPSTPDRTVTSADAMTEFVSGVRQDAMQIATDALGDERLRELRARGQAMDTDQACVYARGELDAYLATLDEDVIRG